MRRQRSIATESYSRVIGCPNAIRLCAAGHPSAWPAADCDLDQRFRFGVHAIDERSKRNPRRGRNRAATAGNRLYPPVHHGKHPCCIPSVTAPTGHRCETSNALACRCLRRSRQRLRRFDHQRSRLFVPFHRRPQLPASRRSAPPIRRSI